MSIVELDRQTSGIESLASFSPMPGFVAEILSPDDEVRREMAVELEKATLTMLGDEEGFEEYVDKQIKESGFLLVYEKDVLIGALRYLLPRNKTDYSCLSEVSDYSKRGRNSIEELFVDQSGDYTFRKQKYIVEKCAGSGKIIDAAILAPVMTKPERIEEFSDVLAASCPIVGRTLLEAGERTHVVSYLHGIFLGHTKKLGYPFNVLQNEEGEPIAKFSASRADFIPVHMSLKLCEGLMNEAPSDSHLGIVRACYEKLTLEDRNNIANAMIRSTGQVAPVTQLI